MQLIYSRNCFLHFITTLANFRVKIFRMILLPLDSWEIKTTSKKGRGLFASKKILPGTIIGDYLGLVLNPLKDDISEKDQGLYLLYYHDKALIYPSDIAATGIHLVNHSFMPNCWIYTYQGHTLFFALRQIYPGEELSIAYQLAPNPVCQPCSHQCFCETQFCTGSMHLSNEKFDKWIKFSQAESKQTKRAPIRYGKILPRLKKYPIAIADNSYYPLYGSNKVEALNLQAKKLPSSAYIRRIIRRTGQTLLLPHLNLKIYGVVDNTVISQKKFPRFS